MKMEKFVVLRKSQSLPPTFASFGSGRSTHLTHSDAITNVEEAELTTQEVGDLRRDPRTKAIAPDMPHQLIAPMSQDDVASNTLSDNTWGIEAVAADTSQYDGSGINVAVLDTGIDPSHAAFNGMEIVRKNFTDESDDDLHGHGTHCAGTIFGQDVNGKRIGVARNINKAIIGKVLGQSGGGTLSITRAIMWAVDEGANVVSMSLGIDFPGYVAFLTEQRGYPIEAATSIALQAYTANVNLYSQLTDFITARGSFGEGAVLVAAAGNESRRDDYEIAVAPPAAGMGIISVGALAESGNKYSIANFSNTQCDISAPGVKVVSARLGGGLTAMSGTSMACPHVAGVAALYAQRQKDNLNWIEHTALIAKIIGSGTYQGLTDTIEEEDAGTGLVKAPQ
ncbi:S8 family serine peptidase [Aestuariibacter sp. AA17]|uniref:S8 family serine peptidase n=1 Tax=Fluctibacter corallii TaxID=2984329 RepID=A0ABT3A548_9ALTE|nr:S8 family serine peptidase [Aestuariibacter sp. AA17]MCV2883800.1 S8 family serine peptidase [Aestuariibacter sp. AA17]